MRARIFDPETRKWWTLAAVAFGLFMIMLDNTVVNVALPAIQEDLGADLSELEWIVAGYALTFAALMLTGGKLADLLGRRLIFVVGLAIFTVSSLGCGLADSSELLIAARIVQGVGAALMNPATLSIISATFPPHQRGMAIGIWAGVSALALAIGPLVGGLLTQHASWHWIFFINVPIGLVAIVASFVLIDETKDTSEEQRLDLPGLLTSGIGLFALTYGLIEANTYGWTSGRILIAFAVAAVALVSFVLLELHQRTPMLDLSLFRNSTFAGANAVMLLVALAMFGVFFFVSLYMQNVLGYSAVQAGAAFLPMTLLIVLIAPIAGKTSDRFGSRWMMAAGMLLLAVQLSYFSRLGVEEAYLTLFPAMVIGGVGMALVMTPAAAAAMSGVPVDKVGVGSAVLNSARQVGGSIGIALIGAIIAHEAGGRLHARGLHGRVLRRPRGGVGGRPRRRSAGRAHDPRAPARHRDHGVRTGSGGVTAQRTRLPAEERRAAVLEAASAIFCRGTYRSTTTAEIAKQAGVTEPVLYRHFSSKRDLYLACLEEAWEDTRRMWDDAIAEEPDPTLWLTAMGRAYLATKDRRGQLAHLWLQSLSESSEDPEIRKFVRRQLQAVHRYVADAMRRSQEAGGILPGRDTEVEAWVFISLGLLGTVGRRLGGVVGDDFPRIMAARREWMTGKSASEG